MTAGKGAEDKIDCLLANAHVIDACAGVNGRKDIWIRHGVVAEIADNLCGSDAPDSVIDLEGAYVVPGLIDFHTHIYPQGTPFCVDHEILIERDGTVCFVDAGTTGSHNFPGFRDLVINQSKAHVSCFLHVCCNGLSVLPTKEVGELLDLRLMDVEGAHKTIRANPESILGVKIRLDQWAIGDRWREGLTEAVRLARRNDLPIVVHVANTGPVVSQLVDILEEGDVIAHFCRLGPNNPIDHRNEIHDYYRQARDKGILLDIAHGNGGFSFEPAERIIELEFFPDIISSDISASCLNEKTLGLCNTMSKLYGLGMPLPRIIEACTSTPARYIRNKGLGTIRVGEAANITFLEVRRGDFQLKDRDSSRPFHRVIASRGCIAKGKLLHLKQGRIA